MTPAAGKVLLIDDEPYIIEFLGDELNERGVPFIQASDGKTALELIESERPSVIVSDYKMPGLDGLKLLQFMRNLGTPAPVIWITGNADEAVMTDAWRLGVFHLFEKPFDTKTVVNEIVKAMRLPREDWLHWRPGFLSEAFFAKRFKKLQIELEAEAYECLKDYCLTNGISLNQAICEALRQKKNPKKSAA